MDSEEKKFNNFINPVKNDTNKSIRDLASSRFTLLLEEHAYVLTE